jgi:hypothetical protein
LWLHIDTHYGRTHEVGLASRGRYVYRLTHPVRDKGEGRDDIG